VINAKTAGAGEQSHPIGKEDEKKQKVFDIQTYAKYILREGTITEKRELLTCLKSKVEMKNKKFTLQKV